MQCSLHYHLTPPPTKGYQLFYSKVLNSAFPKNGVFSCERPLRPLIHIFSESSDGSACVMCVCVCIRVDPSVWCQYMSCHTTR